MLLLPESELCTMNTFSESSSVHVSSQSFGQHYINTGVCHDYPPSPVNSTPANHPRQPSGASSNMLAAQHNRKWDINDSTLPVCDNYDPFELWPSGHYRSVYREDSDDARRHVSGWAMRNTNNHNALILKKSCLGVLLCSLDCLFESGRKVHLRPAICDKARRKQIGKPCPNQACSGKLTLLSCRGHCGYPVTHFWRHVNNAVYFQAKGYHDHPRPEVKSLTDKGRHALSKQIKHDGNRGLSAPTKRRFPILTTDDLPDRKVIISAEEDVLCSCPPFECVCSKSFSRKNSAMSSAFGYRRYSPSQSSTFHAQRATTSSGQVKENLAHGSFTQINITNACLPPSTLDISIPNIELFQNCSKYNRHSCYSGSDFIRHGVDCSHSSLSHDHRLAKSQLDSLNSQQFFNFSTTSSHLGINSTPRSLNNSASASISNSFLEDGRDKYRINQGNVKGGEHETRHKESHHSIGVMLKTEPRESVFNGISDSQSEEDDNDFHSKQVYNHLSPNFTTNHQQSPGSLEYNTKFKLSSDTIFKDQEGQEEPTYITLTSFRGYNQANNELHSCRLVHSYRSHNKVALDNEVYPSPPTQLTKVDITTPPNNMPPVRIPRQEHNNMMDLCPSPSVPSRRTSPTMPCPVFNDNSSHTPVNFDRSNTFHSPVNTEVNNSFHSPVNTEGNSSFHSPVNFDKNNTFHSPVNFDKNNTFHSPVNFDKNNTFHSPVNFDKNNTLYSPVNTDRNSPFHSHVNYERNSSFHSPIDICHDRNRWPFLQPGDSGFVQHTSGVAACEGNANVPYGFHCNDMFSNQTSQTYRNNSINITLTYN